MTLPSEAFLLDTNAFIEPKNTWYPFDIVPGYWNFLQAELGGEHVRSIIPVYEELQGHEDELSKWARELGRDRFEDCADDQEIFERYLDVSSYVRSLEGSGQNQKRRNAIEEFLGEGEADPWLVAHAIVYGGTIVTREISHSLRPTKVSIIDVCNHFEVKHIEVVPFLRKARVAFELNKLPQD